MSFETAEKAPCDRARRLQPKAYRLKLSPDSTPSSEPDENPADSRSTMRPNDDIAARILASIAALPLHEQADAIHALIGSALKQMPLEAVYEIRMEILSQFSDDIPIVQSTLDLIDGQLALREIAGAAIWR